jgi:hypothetical protein
MSLLFAQGQPTGEETAAFCRALQERDAVAWVILAGGIALVMALLAWRWWRSGRGKFQERYEGR